MDRKTFNLELTVRNFLLTKENGYRLRFNEDRKKIVIKRSGVYKFQFSGNAVAQGDCTARIYSKSLVVSPLNVFDLTGPDVTLDICTLFFVKKGTKLSFFLEPKIRGNVEIRNCSIIVYKLD